VAEIGPDKPGVVVGFGLWINNSGVAAACAERKLWRKASRVLGMLSAKRRSVDSGDQSVRGVWHPLVSREESSCQPWY
jgi:hypothetical protein